MALAPLLGALSFVVAALGLALLIRPSRKLLVPTRKRAGLVILAGLAGFVAALSLPETHQPQQTVDASAGIAKPSANELGNEAVGAASVAPSITVERLNELVKQADPWTRGTLESMLGGLSLEVRQDDAKGLAISLQFDKAADGWLAESIGTSIAQMAVKELVTKGANPRLQKRVVQVSVYTLDVAESVTGDKQFLGYGYAVYTPQADRIEWRDYASSQR